MAIALHFAGNTYTQDPGSYDFASALSKVFTIPAGSGLYALLAMSSRFGTNIPKRISSASWTKSGGSPQAFSFITGTDIEYDGATEGRIELWELLNLDPGGSTGTLAATLAESTRGAATLAVFSGVDLVNKHRVINAAAVSGVVTFQRDVQSVDATDLVVDFVGSPDENAAYPPVKNAVAQSYIAENLPGLNGGVMRSSMRAAASSPATSSPMLWKAFDDIHNVNCAYVGMALIPAGASEAKKILIDRHGLRSLTQGLANS